MIERERFDKVIKGLECCISGNPAICKRVGCPYAEEHVGIGDICIDHLMADAFALLKAQEPRARHRFSVGVEHTTLLVDGNKPDI